MTPQNPYYCCCCAATLLTRILFQLTVTKHRLFLQTMAIHRLISNTNSQWKLLVETFLWAFNFSFFMTLKADKFLWWHQKRVICSMTYIIDFALCQKTQNRPNWNYCCKACKYVYLSFFEVLICAALVFKETFGVIEIPKIWLVVLNLPS